MCEDCGFWGKGHLAQCLRIPETNLRHFVKKRTAKQLMCVFVYMYIYIYIYIYVDRYTYRTYLCICLYMSPPRV